MSQFNQPVRRGGGLDVYTGLLFISTLVLLAGIGLMALRNIEHSKAGGGSGSPIELINAR
ncbi:MAG: hypothetical protein AB8G96_08950 [Phycisphaerales bacterium]